MLALPIARPQVVGNPCGGLTAGLHCDAQSRMSEVSGPRHSGLPFARCSARRAHVAVPITGRRVQASSMLAAGSAGVRATPWTRSIRAIGSTRLRVAVRQYRRGAGRAQLRAGGAPRHACGARSRSDVRALARHFHRYGALPERDLQEAPQKRVEDVGIGNHDTMRFLRDDGPCDLPGLALLNAECDALARRGSAYRGRARRPVALLGKGNESIHLLVRQMFGVRDPSMLALRRSHAREAADLRPAELPVGERGIQPAETSEFAAGRQQVTRPAPAESEMLHGEHGRVVTAELAVQLPPLHVGEVERECAVANLSAAQCLQHPLLQLLLAQISCEFEREQGSVRQ